MSYQVLARKWRPRSFQAMVGQEHVLRALINALDHQRLHHAYLFTGTRGVGKTTLARILAKCLNCETGVTSSPCGVCGACQEIDQGRFLDLIEVDAASRTKVEDTRELLENVQYAPSRGRYKVYLIDEVHMLSGHSFNALLKTLEEPPPHVKFLLATTDPQKVPVTVLSRCLQFNLKRLDPERIAAQLAHVLAQEGIPGEPPALRDLALAADGSMRDALSLLDQAIAFGGGTVAEVDVRSMLGSIDRGRVRALLGAIAAADAAGLLDLVAALAEQAPDFNGVLGELLSLLQRVAVAQLVPEVIDDSLGDRDAVLDLARRLSAEDVQLYYQIGLLGRRDLPFGPDPRGGFEMVLLRMLAFRPALDEVPMIAPRERAAPAPPAQAAPPSMPAAAPAAPTAPATSAAPAAEETWEQMVRQLGLSGLTLQLANQCVLERREGSRVFLALDPAHASALTERQTARLQEALSRHLGGPVKLEVRIGTLQADTPAQRQQRRQAQRQQAAEQSISADPNVQALIDTFAASVVPGSVRPLGEKD